MTRTTTLKTEKNAPISLFQSSIKSTPLPNNRMPASQLPVVVSMQ
ncbi:MULTISPECIES: hypothetical protein [unclassified Bartonella]|nr:MULTISPECIES: hypothetical protein [unclassified Bartonella]